MERLKPELSSEQLAQRRGAAVTHGAHTPNRVKPLAEKLKRDFLKRAGLTEREIAGIAYAHLDNWARAQSKVQLLDDWANEHGFLDADGNLPPWATFYLAALNSARLGLKALTDFLAERGQIEPSMVSVLQASARSER